MRLNKNTVKPRPRRERPNQAMQNLQHVSMHCFRVNLEHLETYFAIKPDTDKMFAERIAQVERKCYGFESAVRGPIQKMNHIYMELNRSNELQKKKQ